MTLIKVNISKVKVIVHTLHNPCPGHYSLLPCWIFCSIVDREPRMCHELDLRSYCQGEDHSAHIPKIRIRAIIKVNVTVHT